MSAQAMTIGSETGATGTNGQSIPAFPAQVVPAMEEHPAWPMIACLPVMLAVSIPLRGFRVCDLLGLRSGQTVASSWPSSENVPLKVGLVQLGWGEFEVVEQNMALRLTRLA